ncbi:MAG TPA: cytochrome c oxidase subunit II [Gemmataceae bacterium]|nr:cytochrome c oxidase subunit II [Gemmataceae bacterium]
MFAQIPLLPEQASTHASAVDSLLTFIVTVCGFFAVLIGVLLVTFAIRYRRRTANDLPKPVASSLKLELTWSLIPLAFMMVFFVWGVQLYFSWARPPDDVMEVHVVGRQWMWKMQHMGGQREINQLHVPVGRAVKLSMISEDVIHSFFVPAFRVHMDVLPGRYTTLWFQATKPGRYHLFCSQYCGTNHAKMIGEVIVMERDEYQTWLSQGVDGSPASEGRKLFMKLQCSTCHNSDSSARGPLLEGIFQNNVTLENGATVRIDETYLRESILYPDAKVVAGFKPIMPSYLGQVNEEEVLQLISFIKSLQHGQTPPRTENADPPLNPVLEKKKGKSP